MNIKSEFRHLLPSLTNEQVAGLEQDILKNGCLQPLITWNGILIDGHHRYDICQKHNISFETKEMQFESEYDALFWCWINQKNRRNLSAYEAGRLALMFEPAIKKEAKERQSLGGKTKLPQNSAEAAETRDKIAEIAGISHDTISKIKTIEASASPELKQQLETQEISINQAYKEIKKQEKRDDYIARVQNKSLPDGKYNVIYADPPWEYSNSGFNTSAASNYNTMATNKICELPINNLADEKSVLFLWSTNPLLEDAFKVIKAWGFEYKTNIVWLKSTHIAGFYVYGKHEMLLIATKGGAFTPIGEKFNSVFEFSNKQHSKKPEEFYEIIEKMYPKCKYLELFARNKRESWVGWGNEI